MVVCHLPFGPTAYFGVHHCVLRHDIGSKDQVGTISEVFPNLVFENFSTQLGDRFATILKALFPVPKPSNKRIVTFANRSDNISFRCVILTPMGIGGLPGVKYLLNMSAAIYYAHCTDAVLRPCHANAR